MNFMSLLGIRFRIANNCTRWREIFKGLSQDGGQADFSENLRASRLYNGLSNEPSRWTIPLNNCLAASQLFIMPTLNFYYL
jgi:hypothetical protein